MSWKKASKIRLTEKQKQILREKAAGTHTPLHLKTRAQIILMAAEELTNKNIGETMDITDKTVKKWRDRYSRQYEELQRIELEKPHKLRNTIEKILSDAQRPGGPATFKDEQVAAIMAMACEDPEKFDLAISHWTPRLLRIEVIKLGIVDDISERQIGRFLKRKRFTAPSEPMLVEP